MVEMEGGKEVCKTFIFIVEGLKQSEKMLSAVDRGHEGRAHSYAQAGEETFLSC